MRCSKSAVVNVQMYPVGERSRQDSEVERTRCGVYPAIDKQHAAVNEGRAVSCKKSNQRRDLARLGAPANRRNESCLLYTSDAADE